MRIIACDDNEEVLKLLEKWTKEWMGDNHYEYLSYQNGWELMEDMEKYRETEPQIIFMDIRLKDDNGIDIAKTLNREHRNVAFIFISGYTEYVENSFEADPVYFLIKPLKQENFQKAIEKAAKKLRENTRKFYLVKGKELQRIFHDEIYYGESIARKVKLYCTFGEVEFYERMDNLERELGCDFVRHHKSYIANMRYVRSVDSRELTMINGVKIPISRNKAQETREKVFAYLGN